MMNDEFKNEMPTSQEFYADQAPADWANEAETPRERFEREVGSDDHLDEHLEQHEDAPTYDEVADTYAADAWHDAHEYPEW